MNKFTQYLHLKRFKVLSIPMNIPKIILACIYFTNILVQKSIIAELKWSVYLYQLQLQKQTKVRQNFNN